jgi:biopolymer transport protein ExbD
VSKIKMVSAETAVSPNLVPMVDIMFLLLLFLMVGADMRRREREEVHLPLASSAKQENPNQEDESAAALVLNVYHVAENCSAYEVSGLCTEKSHWSIGCKGTDYGEEKAADLKAFLEGEVQNDREHRGLPPPEAGKLKPPSELRVMIRADRAALFAFVQRAMNSCADAGIYKIEIGAKVPAPAEGSTE